MKVKEAYYTYENSNEIFHILLDVLLHIQKEVKRRTLYSTVCGICLNLEWYLQTEFKNRVELYNSEHEKISYGLLSYRFVMTYSKGWSLHSGIQVYPVPIPAERKDTDNIWTHSYGKNRKKLLQYLIDRCRSAIETKENFQLISDRCL